MKKFLAMVLAVVMMLSLVACGGGNDKKSDGKVKLDIIISQYTNYTQEWWKQFETDFEKANQDIDLNIEIVSWNDIYSVVNTRISTKEQPDILNISGFTDYVADDLLVPAEDYVSEEVKNNFIPSFWSSNEMDGTVWALPILASCRSMYCNMDILKQAGVEIPTTWDEVVAACEAVKEKCPGVTPWGMDISQDEGVAAFAYYAWNMGGGFVDENGEWALNSAENVKAVEYIKSLVDAGFCNSDPYNDTKYNLYPQFNNGTLAMMIGPMNMITPDENGNTVNYVAADMPGDKVRVGVCDQLMVFKDKDAPDQEARLAAITKFFDAFYECETYSNYMVYEGFLPATKDAAESLPKTAEKYTVGGPEAKTGDNQHYATFCEALANCQFYPMQKDGWPDVRVGVAEVEQQVCQGVISAQAALDNLQAKVAG